MTGTTSSERAAGCASPLLLPLCDVETVVLPWRSSSACEHSTGTLLRPSRDASFMRMRECIPMPRILLVKTDSDTLLGVTEADEREFRRYLEHVNSMQPGETIGLSWSPPRSPVPHGIHFAMLRRLFEAQAVFSDPEALRAWATVGAGHADYVPGPDGVLIAVPRSISYDALEEPQFRAHHQRVVEFLHTPQALSFLWPDARDSATALRHMDQLTQTETTHAA
ncbi:DUF1367 family protein [Paraburkholderia sp. BR10923]|uniref:DUF1367 family protein n=1 Tax=Paraburkholderia sp. BR10923 TaxID=3236992 RepID=UPI0034CDD1B9